MTIARHRPLNFPRSWDWDTSTRQLVAMGYDPISLMKFSSTPAPEPLEGNNLGLRTGGRVGVLKLVAVKIYASALAALSPVLPPASMSSTTTTDTSYLFLAAPDVRPARYTLDGEPFVEVLAEGGVVPWGDSVEPNGQRVVTSGFREAGKLRVLADDDLGRLLDAIAAAGGERNDAPDEQPLVDPRWPLDVQVATLATMLRKVLNRLDALESNDESDDAPDARPRRPHRRVHPLPKPITN